MDIAINDTNPTQPSEPSKSIPVVAIGAAAGGLASFVQLLKHLSATLGFAYIYVQHQEKSADDQLTSVLSPLASMPVLEAKELMRIEPNHVYVIPPGKLLEIEDGMLIDRPDSGNSAMNMPIDQFFSCLANRQQDGAIGVILSGAINDGIQGLKSIKAAGGITFAQNETAAFQGMPKAAIAEGVVDKVLSPAEIAQELERLSYQTALFKEASFAISQEESAINEDDFKLIIQLLRKVTGVDFIHYKKTTIRRRTIRRMLLYKMESLKEYAAYLRNNPAEATELYKDLLINVTDFFRDGDIMTYLKEELLPTMMHGKMPRESFRVWIPACSTGQEAYSLAMLMVEVLSEQGFSMPIQIFATDLSESAITRARLGMYTQSEMQNISPRRLQRFFTKVDNYYRINKFIRDMCVFAPHNIFSDPPFSRIDLVSCRNLLIYVDNTLQKKAIATFHYALNESGYLLLGKSETIGLAASLFVPVDKAYKVYARRNDVTRRATFDMSPRTAEPYVVDGRDGGSRVTGSGKPTSLANDLEKLVDSLLLSHYVPASVVVNRDLDILQFRGATGLFLEPAPGKASLNLLKMARQSLVLELRNAVHKVVKTGQPVRKTGLEVKIKDRTHLVAIEAVPLKTESEEPLFLILFEETIPVLLPETDSIDLHNNRIQYLENELETLREDMRSIIEEQEASNEELQAANEEIISSNEELQSINEELETSKEEIESSNEELLTINQELQVRNDQLMEAYEYSEAILATIREATLVLDEDLRVRSANRAFYTIFKVKQEDIEGQLIYELGDRQWNIPKLRELLEHVINHKSQLSDFEVTHAFPRIGVKIMRLNARKVVQHQRQESILLAIEDITEHRLAQQLLEEREAWFHNIANNAPMLMWIAGPDGRYNFLNKTWLNYTGRKLEDEVRLGWAQNIHPDDRNTYIAAFNTNFEQRQAFTSEYRLMRYDGDYRWMMEKATPMFSPEGLFTGYMGICVEIKGNEGVSFPK